MANDYIVRVGGGCGFAIDAGGRRLILTAAHCLPRLPRANPQALGLKRSWKFVGPRGRQVTAACVFADPIADIAVLGVPDEGGERPYEMLVGSMLPLRMGRLLSRKATVERETPVQMMGLDGKLVTGWRNGEASPLCL
jgi:hypothetical protein